MKKPGSITFPEDPAHYFKLSPVLTYAQLIEYLSQLVTICDKARNFAIDIIDSSPVTL